ILHDVMKTLEFQVKQTEDQHVAEIMVLMRQVQRKNEQLEHQLAQEREKIAQERQKIIVQQNSVREQGELRKKTIESRLRASFTTTDPTGPQVALLRIHLNANIGNLKGEG